MCEEITSNAPAYRLHELQLVLRQKLQLILAALFLLFYCFG